MNLASSKHIEEFVPGEILYHGAVQVTPFRNKEYIKKFNKNYALGADSKIAESLGYIDPNIEIKRQNFGIQNPSIISQGYLFNVGFGLSVHDISFNAIANLSYKNLRYGVPAYEGDILFATSEVLGIEVKKDGASNGSVQVKTTITNQDNKVVLEYVRQVLVRASNGTTLDTQSSIQEQPERIGLTEAMMPLKFQGLPNKFNDQDIKAFEDFEIEEIYNGDFSKSINLVDFSWLQISTLNDASVHHTPKSNFIGYGGAVKSTVEGEVSSHIPYAYFLGMNSGSHDAPTYPSDIIQSMFDSSDEDDEKIIGSFKIKNKDLIESREDFGILTIELCGDKIVTDAGLKAYEKAGFKGVSKIADNKIRVLTMEMIVAIPTKVAFK
tara:strand:+ start:47408 stop:48550 length:1143 start_codon:yes stop_codon:yes gene_type:complete